MRQNNSRNNLIIPYYSGDEKNKLNKYDNKKNDGCCSSLLKFLDKRIFEPLLKYCVFPIGNCVYGCCLEPVCNCCSKCFCNCCFQPFLACYNR